MSDAMNVEATKEVVAAANNAATELLAAVFKNLKEVPVSSVPINSTDPCPRFFFPHGIEIIYLKVDAYFSEKIHGTAVIEIAGDKSITPAIALNSIQA